MVLSLKSSPPSPPRTESLWDTQMFSMETFSYDDTANDLGDLFGDTDFGDQIYREEMESLMNRGLELVTEIPRYDIFKTSLYRHRREALGITREPQNAQDVVLDNDLITMSNGTSFLVADFDLEDGRIIILGTELGKKMMTEKSHFFMDGTFKSCSIQFKQIYSIHADLGGRENETNVVPLIYALLPNKKEETYKKLFQKLMEEIPDWRPSTVSVDFEAASVSALRQAFPDVQIEGCFFHFSQCLWRKVQEFGLATLYRNSEEVRMTIRKCAALAFLSLEDIEDGWLVIQETAPESVNNFMDYFVEQWMENPSVPVEMWNCGGRRHRTTNVVEGWHCGLNGTVGRPHPRIHNLIGLLKKEAESVNFKITRNMLNLEGKKRQRRHLRIDERIDRAKRSFQHHKDINRFLENVALVIKMD